jgi:hypothetical protein
LRGGAWFKGGEMPRYQVAWRRIYRKYGVVVVDADSEDDAIETVNAKMADYAVKERISDIEGTIDYCDLIKGEP